MRPFLFSRRSILVFSLLLFTGSFSYAQKKLIVLGDSLTEGYGVAKDAAYPALLEKKLHEAGKKEWTVVNSGVSGSTTASGVSRMKWLFKSKPEAVLLVLGANDGLRGLKIEDSQKNLSDAIEYANSQKVRVILGGLYMPPNYGVAYTDKFKKMYESLAKKYKVTFIPFVLDKVAGNPKYNLADGIHPNEEGHKIIAENIFQVLKGEL
ncbi:arylesterase [Bdellovibrio bacteriovorus]|uniref:Arylesterase n=1 Tax=Bdellovibrio bacteriovorus TaxID=959 RepID=A0A150WBY8_BDEBC|nr:arylesterase [Bdellovibrio bacteriovorus]KYG60554.1 arylesterase [Bdellovibrio bacteriovorus]